LGLLDQIESPDDLKRLSRNELPELAAAIRRVIVDVVSKMAAI
jgi:1-deoxy-D-xylulose-5-phosphate synthase